MTSQRPFCLGLLATAFLVFSTSTVSAATSVSGTYNTDVVWTLAGSPYIVESNLIVGAAATLVIQPGVIVKFRGTNEDLDINGVLVAVGSATQHITFTSIEDDEIGGDTGADGPTQGAPGQWEKIRIVGTARLVFVDVRYGGYGGSNTSSGAINVTADSTGYVDHTTSRYNQRSGLYALRPTVLTITRSDFSWNAVGISVHNAPVAIASGTSATQ